MTYDLTSVERLFSMTLLPGLGVFHDAAPSIHGVALQVDPMNSILKGPGSQCSKLEHEKLLSNCAFTVTCTTTL
jgi:hypothetical protein